MKAKAFEGTKISVYFTFCKRDDNHFLHHVGAVGLDFGGMN